MDPTHSSPSSPLMKDIELSMQQASTPAHARELNEDMLDLSRRLSEPPPPAPVLSGAALTPGGTTLVPSVVVAPDGAAAPAPAPQPSGLENGEAVKKTPLAVKAKRASQAWEVFDGPDGVPLPKEDESSVATSASTVINMEGKPPPPPGPEAAPQKSLKNVRVFGRTLVAPAPSHAGSGSASDRLKKVTKRFQHAMSVRQRDYTNPARLDATVSKTRRGAPHIGWDLHLQHNIVRYDASALFNWAFLQMKTATVVTWRLVLEVVLLCGVATVFGFYRCDPNRSDLRPGVRDWKNWTVCVPLENSQALTLASLAAFLLSLFTSLIFTRYWQTRSLLQKMFGITNRVVLSLYAFVDTDNEDGLAMVNDIIRYMHLGLALFHKHARTMGGKLDSDRPDTQPPPLPPARTTSAASQAAGPGAPRTTTTTPVTRRGSEGALPPAEEGRRLPDPLRYEDLLRDHLLTEDELDLLRGVNNKWQICFGWAMRIVREVQKQNKIMAASPNICFAFQRDICDVQFAASEVLGVISTPIPYAYAHLLSVMTKFHLAFITLYGASVIGAGFLNLTVERIVLGYLIIGFNALIFEGILLLYVQLDNPLGFDPCDFPVMNYRKSALADTSATARLIGQSLPDAVARYKS